MASYRGHLALSSLLGAGFGCAIGWQLHPGWGSMFLAAGLTTLAGMLPDLDSDTSVPVRELFGLAAAAVALLVMRPLEAWGYSFEERLVLVGALYLFVRYGVRALFARFTIHRGMFHSIPAMFIASLAVFLLDRGPDLTARLCLAIGTALGFLSHLILDEIYGINLLGSKGRMSRYAGSPLKLYSGSWTATLTTYVLLAGLTLLAWQEIVALRA